MSNLLKELSEEEINEVTELGKGCNYYYLALCGAGWDSGTCTWVFENCGYNPGSGGGSGCTTGAGCTCR